jgi:predicted CXXCH cytochrome family protein
LNGHPGTGNNGCVYCHHWTIVGNDIFNVSRPDNSDCIQCHGNSATYQINSAHQTYRCVACHSPHGSSQQHLLRKGPNSLCTEKCHGLFQLGRSHPRGPGMRDINTGGDITCTSSCHRIHAICTDKLLSNSTPVLCAGCHPDKL